MIPTFCMVPITIGGIVYGIIMGAITGYFSAAVGMLFVIAGIIGIISAAFPGRKALAVFYLIALVVVNFLALVINVCGVADPQYLTTMEERDLGFIKLEPNVLWFLGGLLFMTLFCIPCITIAVVNVCTFKPRQPHEKVSRWKLARTSSSYNDEEKRAGIPVDLPDLKSFKVEEDGRTDVNGSDDFVPSNPSMKRRKKSDASKFGNAYSDSGVLDNQNSSKKKKKAATNSEVGKDGEKKLFFKLSKQAQKKVDEKDTPDKIVPITTATSSSTNGV